MNKEIRGSGGMYYNHKQKNGKNSKVWYYLLGLVRFYGPSAHLRRRLKKKLASVNQREDKDYILERVNYYNKLSEMTDPGRQIMPISDQSITKGRSLYVLDTQQYLRWFPRNLRWNYLFGDITEIPTVPTILKSRPIKGDNANSVLLNLDKARHFTFLNDRIPFRQKESKFIFRGHIVRKPNRIMFMEKFFGHPMCDAGIIPFSDEFPAEWGSKRAITLWEHLKYRYIMALEGNDVASNLKWIMSSNSIAVTPRPIYETWFMEGKLIPDYHYIEVKSDFSDIVEKLTYYDAHPDRAEAIIRNAHEYIEQFLDPEREDLISLLVVDKYFKITNQI